MKAKIIIFLAGAVCAGCDLVNGVPECKEKIKEMTFSPSSVEFVSVDMISDDMGTIIRKLRYELEFDARTKMNVPLRYLAVCDVLVLDSGRSTSAAITKLTDNQGRAVP